MSRPKIAYVVTSGCYSDYHIDAVFSTKELAESYVAECDSCSYSDGADVEEFVIDEESTRRAVDKWLGEIECGTGSIGAIVKQRHFNYHDDRSGVGSPHDRYSTKSSERVRIISGHSWVSEDHCRQILTEARQAWLREKTENGIK